MTLLYVTYLAVVLLISWLVFVLGAQAQSPLVRTTTRISAATWASALPAALIVAIYFVELCDWNLFSTAHSCGPAADGLVDITIGLVFIGTPLAAAWALAVTLFCPLIEVIHRKGQTP